MRSTQIKQVTARRFLWLRLGIVAIAIIFILTIGLTVRWGGEAQAQSVQELQNYQNYVEQQRQIIQKQQEQINALTKPAQSRLEALRRNVRVTDAQIQDNEKKNNIFSPFL
jgi:uncharacterized protein HemX